MQYQSNKIVARIYGYGRGVVFTPKDFHDLANHANIRAALSRLAKEGTIRRLLRGVYDYPEFSQVMKAPASPDPEAVAQAYARAHGWTILPEGNTALNLLGLSTQVPAHWHYFSDGPSKKIEWMGGTLVFTHRGNKEVTRLSPKTGLLVQALKALGESQVDAAVLATLRQKMTDKELHRAVREAGYATAWVYEVIKRLAAATEAPHA